MEKKNERSLFVTRLGVIATTVGSAVGLGNIWRFPYEAGTQGGGAFLLLYLVFIVVLGIPMLCGEFMIGRESRCNIFGTFRKLHPGGMWHLTGYVCILASLMILGFYSVVAGWTLEYLYQSPSGGLTGDLHSKFLGFLAGWRPILWTVVFLILNFLVISRGVQKGLEKVSNLLMPLMFMILVGFCIYAMTLPKAAEGLAFLFKPDFSELRPMTALKALGQAFFSLSLGMGCMLTYGSYFNDKTNITRSAVITAGLDTLVALMAGMVIFPAVFSYGFSPQGGPTLVFEVLPAIFSHIDGGAWIAALFFFMLFLASLTSTISLSEISITFLCEEWKMKRLGASIANTAIGLVGGVLCALSFGMLKNLNLFNIFDFTATNVLLPLGGLLTTIFASWVISKKVLYRQISNNGTLHSKFFGIIIFCLKYVAPVALVIILLMGIGVFGND